MSGAVQNLSGSSLGPGVMGLPTSVFRGIINAAADFCAFPAWRGFAPGVWLEAIAFHESSGNPNAFHEDKPGWLTTSYGLFQIEGSTAVGLLPGLAGPSPLYFPLQNLALACRLLEQLLNRFGRSQDEYIDQAVAAFNGGFIGAMRDVETGELGDQVYVDFIRNAAQLVAEDRSKP